jgi:hypothetical protein
VPSCHVWTPRNFSGTLYFFWQKRFFFYKRCREASYGRLWESQFALLRDSSVPDHNPEPPLTVQSNQEASSREKTKFKAWSPWMISFSERQTMRSDRSLFPLSNSLSLIGMYYWKRSNHDNETLFDISISKIVPESFPGCCLIGKIKKGYIE